MKNYVIIVAGGIGKRMQSDTPKQFLLLSGKPVLMHTIEVFRKFDSDMTIILVLPKDQIPIWDKLCLKHNFKERISITYGGETRFHSVQNGLKFITEPGIVGIHDGVRPFVNQETIRSCFNKASNLGTAIPIRDMDESLRYFDSSTTYAVHRENLKIVQTPQVFKSEIIIESYNKEFKEEFTDDASVVERSGFTINLINGNRENIKLTTPFDFKIGEVLINEK